MINYDKKIFRKIKVNKSINSLKLYDSKSKEKRFFKKQLNYDYKNTIDNKFENINSLYNKDKSGFNIFKYQTKLFILNSNYILDLYEKLKKLNEIFEKVIGNPDNKQSNLIKMERKFFKSCKPFEHSKKEAKNIPNRKYHRYIFERNFANFIILMY